MFKIIENLVDSYIGKSLKSHAALKLCALAWIASAAAAACEISQYEQFSTNWWLWLLTGLAAKALYYGAPIAACAYLAGDLIICIGAKASDGVFNASLWLYGAARIIAGTAAWLTLLGVPGVFIAGCMQLVLNGSLDATALAVLAIGNAEGVIGYAFTCIRLVIIAVLIFDALSVPVKNEEPRLSPEKIRPPMPPYPGRRISKKEDS